MSYPTNAYTTINLTVDNIADHREKRHKATVDAATGLTTLDHSTRTLYDLINGPTADTTDYLFTLGGGLSAGALGTFVTSLKTLSLEQRNYFAKMKQIKLLRMTERARQIAFELKREQDEMRMTGNGSLQNLPGAAKPAYPSSQTIRSFPNR